MENNRNWEKYLIYCNPNRKHRKRRVKELPYGMNETYIDRDIRLLIEKLEIYRGIINHNDEKLGADTGEVKRIIQKLDTQLQSLLYDDTYKSIYLQDWHLNPYTTIIYKHYTPFYEKCIIMARRIKRIIKNILSIPFK